MPDDRKEADRMERLATRVGIGFATGRKSFQNVLRSYVFHLEESKFPLESGVSLNLFVAFDPAYSGTKREDYEEIEPRVRRWFDEVFFFSPEDVKREAEKLAGLGIVPAGEARLCFGNGYAAQRNIVLYQALRQKMDYLIFFDDDEYPMAVTNSDTSGVALWSGQRVIETHVKYLQFSDVTNGYHCGYLSPLPSLELDGILDERAFRKFVEAMSSDVLKWEDVKEVMQNGGVTYADKTVITQSAPQLVEAVNGAKFITGGNLGFNLTNPQKVAPFYNPPGARGEDSFLGTCLGDHTVKRIPAYTFHDGFALYSNLLRGVLPTNLKGISLYDSREVIGRFHRACIGWVRYKPLYMRITHPDTYREILEDARNALRENIPSVCAYFNDRAFYDILTEFERYTADAEAHLREFRRAREIWEAMKAAL